MNKRTKSTGKGSQYYSSKPRRPREPLVYEHAIPSREEIFSTLEKANTGKSINTLAKMLFLDENAMQALKNRLRAMTRDGQLRIDRSDKYTVTKNSQLIEAKVYIQKNKVVTVEPIESTNNIRISVGHKQAGGLMLGDTVLVRHFPDKPYSCLPIIAKINQRALKGLVGRIKYDGDKARLETIGTYIVSTINVKESESIEIEDGVFVYAKIVQYPNRHLGCEVEVESLLGTLDDANMIQDAMIHTFSLPGEFTQPEVDAANRIEKRGITIDSYRTDWRQKNFITIDGADARDFDDAICIESEDDGWRVYVAISDVSYYIEAGSALDKAAYARATSVYFPNSVLPMLPKVLSDGLCSLCPDVDRLVKGIEIKLSREGKVEAFQFHKAVICSKKRLTYVDANEIITGSKSTDKWLEKMLQQALAVYELLDQCRRKRGALEIDLPYTKIVFNQYNKIESIGKEKRVVTHKIIEELMLLANEITASYLLRKKQPALYRNHSKPDVTKLKSLRAFLANLNIPVKLSGRDHIPTKDLQKVIRGLMNSSHGDLYIPIILSTLAQACYEEKNTGHYGLAYEHYCHFTSPIRRYPDLIVHRALDNCILKEKTPILSDGITLRAASRHCSTTERVADDAQKRSMQWLKCYYMMDHVGKTFKGTITMVKGFGFFVSIDNYLIDGLVHISTLNDYYTYDEKSMCLLAQNHNENYRIGQEVFVKIQKIDILELSIDLILD